MSRAFVTEDSGGPDPKHQYPMPDRDDPGYDLAAARALIRGANGGDSDSAEIATGYRFGEPKLVPWIKQILEDAIESNDERLQQLAERFLRKAGVDIP